MSSPIVWKDSGRSTSAVRPCPCRSTAITRRPLASDGRIAAYVSLVA